jgi:alanine racemase
MSPTSYIEIDLRAFRFNLRQVNSRLKRRTKILLIVKSNAYGHGMLRIAREAQKKPQVVYMGISSMAEALLLRKAGIRGPLLILGVMPPTEYREAIKQRLTLTVSSLEEARAINRAAQPLKRKAKVHVELDTGMGRLGAWCAEAIWLLFKIHQLTHVDMEGIFTHFPSADEDDPKYSRFQIEVFNKAVDLACELFGKPFRYVHMANSTGLITYRDSHFSLVRPGIMAYGIYPAPKPCPIKLKPVLALRSKISFIKSVPKGRTISYARSYVVSKATRIATIPIGYYSGYPLRVSNRASVLIHGKRYPVVGRVTMDHLMVDIGWDKRIRKWDPVTLVGKSGRQEICVEELARWAQTIPYDIVCSFNGALPRIYIG